MKRFCAWKKYAMQISELGRCVFSSDLCALLSVNAVCPQLCAMLERKNRSSRRPRIPLLRSARLLARRSAQVYAALELLIPSHAKLNLQSRRSSRQPTEATPPPHPSQPLLPLPQGMLTKRKPGTSAKPRTSGRSDPLPQTSWNNLGSPRPS